MENVVYKFRKFYKGYCFNFRELLKNEMTGK